MPLHVPLNHYNAKLRWRLNGDPEEMITTIGLWPTEVPPAGRQINDVAQAVYEAWWGAFPSQHLGSQWQFVGVDVVEGAADGEGAVGSYQLIQAGTGEAPSLPQNCALLVRKRTTVAGRKFTGRMYLPGGYLSEGEVDAAGRLSIALFNARQAGLDQFLENLRDESEAPGAVIQSLDPRLFHTDPAIEPTPVTTLQAQQQIATQRRRLRR